MDNEIARTGGTNSYEEHMRYLYECAKTSKEIMITTGNVYAGITYYGSDTFINSDRHPGRFHLDGTRNPGHSQVRSWLDYLEDTSGRVNVKILVSIPFYKSCKASYCEDCAKEFTKMMLKLSNHAKFFNNLKWFMKEHLYLKAIAFRPASGLDSECRGVITTRNLTDMDQNQYSTLNDDQSLFKQVANQFDDCMRVNDDNVSRVLEKLNIKTSTIENLING
ncbi:hypothetical protein N9045_00420 [bacterium]|nr:hypothetical protein [bacterium]